VTCEVCGRGMADGVSLFRQNPKGQKGVWRCRECNARPIDPEVNDIVSAIEDDNAQAGREQ
jgi:hypothetical protein